MPYKFPKAFGDYKKYTKTPNDISCGALYTKTIKIDVPNEQERIIRVYLPKDYDHKKVHPVMFMCDGQNMVDAYTSAYGEWDIDDHNSWLVDNGYPSIVLVGIDCPKNPLYRGLEYVIPSIKAKKFNRHNPAKLNNYGRQYAKFVIEQILPEIRKLFSVSDKKELTAYGGSSMGGQFAFDVVNHYPDVFGFSLAFSPAFMLFSKFALNKFVSTYYKNSGQKIYLYTGAVGFEKQFLKPTKRMYKLLKKIGFNDNVKLDVDLKGEHNEASWSKHFIPAVLYWFNKN